jgi:NADH-quinone oxidoreductase subunit N
MTKADVAVILPILIMGATSLVVMLTIAFYRSHILTAFLTWGGIVLSLSALVSSYPLLPRQVSALLILDPYSAFFSGLILAAAFFVAALSYGYLEKREGNKEEFYLLLTAAILGSMVLVASAHFASLFLGLEILSVSLYAMIAYLHTDGLGLEAGIKYLVLAAASAASLLFGMALIYGELGTMSLLDIGSRIASSGPDIFLLAGTALIMVGLGFKLAVVPFHMWTPDVYQGAPAPVSAFIASVSKGAVLAVLLRYFTLINIKEYSPIFLMFTLIAIASMFFGNLLALLQNNIKRILAYSSISHLGYLLVAFLASRNYAAKTVAFYLITYFVTIIGAFGIITLLSNEQREADGIDDYTGIAWRRPLVSGLFTAMLLSLAGIPLTAGFIGKFYIIRAGAGSALWLLVISLVINSAIGLFYYLRVIITMYKPPVETGHSPIDAKISLGGGLLLAALLVLLIWIGVYPAVFIDIIEKMIGGKFS